MRPAPPIPRQPGDRLRAEDWNQAQIRLEESIGQHRHALGAEVLAADARVRAAHLQADTLTVAGQPLSTALQRAAIRAGEAAIPRALSMDGGTVDGDLTVRGDLKVSGSLRVDGSLHLASGDARGEQAIARGPERILCSGALPHPSPVDRFEPNPWYRGASPVVISTLTLATFHLHAVLQGPGVQPQAQSRWHAAVALFLGRGEQLMNEARIAKVTLRPAILDYTPDERVEIDTCGTSAWYVQDVRWMWAGDTSDYSRCAYVHHKTPDSTTRTFLLDPGEWRWELRAVASPGIEVLGGMQVHLLPLPEEAR